MYQFIIQNCNTAIKLITYTWIDLFNTVEVLYKNEMKGWIYFVYLFLADGGMRVGSDHQAIIPECNPSLYISYADAYPARESLII